MAGLFSVVPPGQRTSCHQDARHLHDLKPAGAFNEPEAHASGAPPVSARSLTLWIPAFASASTIASRSFATTRGRLANGAVSTPWLVSDLSSFPPSAEWYATVAFGSFS